ncbi:Mu-like prophage protein gp29-like [uncultured Mediterranean phage uvMED]|nr:Mu-like prophage protein gp29-like [uncultured Mediterranean phage uvMED]BAR22587.1 SPP1 gp7 family phage putative head morphogenesis protein [uncultured Mediterranean phage uvMED]
MGIFDIFRNKAEESEPQRKARSISRKTIKQQLYRFNQEITNWKSGVTAFEDPYNHTNVDLIAVYNDLVIDSHLSALMNTRTASVLSKDFKVIDEEGEEIKEDTEKLESSWFHDFLSLALESKFFGYSLIEFGSRKGLDFDCVKLVPREYVNAKAEGVRQSPYSNEPLTSYKKGEFKRWTIGVGKPMDLGLLMKAAPIVIYKKTALGAWSEFAELFGSPFRLGKTSIRDEDLRDNMYDMLENMGRNAFGVFDVDDDLEFISDGKSDAYQVYNQLIERSNSELSKLILNSTMVIDDGSSRSQAEVHERNLEKIEKADCFFISELVNKTLIPFLNDYHGFNISGKWCFDYTEKTSKKEQFEIDLALIKEGYKIPNEYLTETYGTPLDEIKELDAQNRAELKKKVHSLDILTASIADFEDIEDPDFSDIEDDIFEGIYNGVYTLGNLPDSIYNRTVEYIMGGVYHGIDEAKKTLRKLPDDAFIKALQNNAFVFSGAKTFDQVKEMSNFLLDEAGEVVPFFDFKQKAAQTFGTYNKNWLKTEYLQAASGAQNASAWQQFEEEKDIFPKLKYLTAKDERVRESHKPLDGIVKPVDDPFWDTYAPANGWNCRCQLEQVEEDEETTPTDKIEVPQDIPPYMMNNVGKTKQLFSPEHPYFIVEDQYKELRADNFGLPEPPKDLIEGKSLENA